MQLLSAEQQHLPQLREWLDSGYRRFPVASCCLGDLETPLSIYLKLATSYTSCMLLVERRVPQLRQYTVIVPECDHVISGCTQRESGDRHDGRLSLESALNEIIFSMNEPIPDVTDPLGLLNGWMGVRYVMTSRPRVDDYCFLRGDTFVVVDHLTRLVHAVRYVDLTLDCALESASKHGWPHVLERMTERAQTELARIVRAVTQSSHSRTPCPKTVDALQGRISQCLHLPRSTIRLQPSESADDFLRALRALVAPRQVCVLRTGTKYVIAVYEAPLVIGESCSVPEMTSSVLAFDAASEPSGSILYIAAGAAPVVREAQIVAITHEDRVELCCEHPFPDVLRSDHCA